jgi:hypothetical protein
MNDPEYDVNEKDFLKREQNNPNVSIETKLDYAQHRASTLAGKLIETEKELAKYNKYRLTWQIGIPIEIGYYFVQGLGIQMFFQADVESRNNKWSDRKWAGPIPSPEE